MFMPSSARSSPAYVRVAPIRRSSRFTSRWASRSKMRVQRPWYFVSRASEASERTSRSDRGLRRIPDRPDLVDPMAVHRDDLEADALLLDRISDRGDAPE